MSHQHRNIRLTPQPYNCPAPNCPLQQSRAVVWRPDNVIGGFIIGRRCDRHASELAQEWLDEGDTVYLLKVEAV